MAGKNPIGRLTDTAIGTLMHPRATAERLVGQARDTAALGRTIAGQVGKAAVSVAVETAGEAVGRARRPGAEPGDASSAEPEDTSTPIAEPAAEPVKPHGDPLMDVQRSADAEPAATTRSPAKKTATKKTATKKSATKKSAATKTAAKKTAAKKSAAPAPSPADVADLVETKSRAGTPTTRRTARKAPPKTARQVQNLEGTDVSTPAGTPGAGMGYNPDTTETDLDQPGTEPIMPESTAKTVKSESDFLRKAAERNPE